MVLLIDNYDSFSYNLYQVIGTLQPDIRVIRNDELTVEEIEELAPSHIVLSPGPGKPKDAGICEDVVRRFGGKFPILGVCLGHQAICEAYGATITYADRLMHGKQSEITIESETKLFRGMERQIKVARYHSLVAEKNTIPEELRVTAVTKEGEIMAVAHKKHDVYGVQFHPESILTPEGKQMIANFLEVSNND
ncbi:MAG: aminodeoxychorismate/anthranilate synthase component II [Clostridiales bacterium]|nr:aminodeoxychorismate/anthranilate synthase component II [Roseburia sp.]MDD7636159.1 aminodeoxychorismate/anthranilate synthase component II [Clostridiales bacterium]MDY4112758.1 aminodeoxychorismate/anthranilate synthase component II [Roseburia sp.]